MSQMGVRRNKNATLFYIVHPIDSHIKSCEYDAGLANGTFCFCVVPYMSNLHFPKVASL